jgi:hypothetical protein
LIGLHFDLLCQPYNRFEVGVMLLFLDQLIRYRPHADGGKKY